MPEDSWLENERKFFVDNYCKDYKINKIVLNKVLRKYNMFLQKTLINESPYIAEDLKLTILKSRGSNGIIAGQKDK